MLLADQFMDQRCRVGDGAELGLPGIGADVAGNQRLTRLKTFLEQQLFQLLAGLWIDVQAWYAVRWSDSCACRLCQFQAIIHLVFVVVWTPVAPRHAVGHKTRVTFASETNAPFRAAQDC